MQSSCDMVQCEEALEGASSAYKEICTPRAMQSQQFDAGRMRAVAPARILFIMHVNNDHSRSSHAFLALARTNWVARSCHTPRWHFLHM